jgi:hypothetical protein
MKHTPVGLEIVSEAVEAIIVKTSQGVTFGLREASCVSDDWRDRYSVWANGEFLGTVLAPRVGCSLREAADAAFNMYKIEILAHQGG